MNLKISESFNKENLSQQKIADKYNVSQVAISCIIRKKSWAYLQ